METSVSSALWTEQQIAYARFLAANKVDVDMRKWTEAEYAEAVGVTDRTLRTWKRLPGFWALVSELVPDTLHKFVPAMMQVQIKKALGGNTESLKLVLNQSDRLKGDKQVHEAGESLIELVELMRNRKQAVDATPAIESGS